MVVLLFAFLFVFFCMNTKCILLTWCNKQVLEIFSIYLPNSPFKAFQLQTMTSQDYLVNHTVPAKEGVDGQSSKDPWFFFTPVFKSLGCSLKENLGN